MGWAIPRHTIQYAAMKEKKLHFINVWRAYLEYALFKLNLAMSGIDGLGVGTKNASDPKVYVVWQAYDVHFFNILF